MVKYQSPHDKTWPSSTRVTVWVTDNSYQNITTSPTHTCNCSDCDSQTCADEMRNPSAYVSNFFKRSDMLHIDYDINIVRFVGSWPGSCAHNVNFWKKLNELFLPKFSISNFRTGVRARGVAAWPILPAWRRQAAACIPSGQREKMQGPSFFSRGPHSFSLGVILGSDFNSRW